MSAGTPRLEALGHDATVAGNAAALSDGRLPVGRIVAQHKERYLLAGEDGDYDAEITGKLRYSASAGADFPAVGDWVLYSRCDAGLAVITAVLPRRSTISRRAAGKRGEAQIIASNIDCAIIVQSADRDFNLRRIDRYLAICSAAAIDAIIVVSKVDLPAEAQVAAFAAALRARCPKLPLVLLSNATRAGVDELARLLRSGRTYCLLGSSGVGKSSLINSLCRAQRMPTAAIGARTHKGRHTTSHRELFVLDDGALLIDNPGMREVGIADDDGGAGGRALPDALSAIAELASRCRFADCTHTREAGCAVLDAIDRGELDGAVYDNYVKLQRERQHYAQSRAEQHRKDRDFGRMVSHCKKVKGLGGW